MAAAASAEPASFTQSIIRTGQTLIQDITELRKEGRGYKELAALGSIVTRVVTVVSAFFIILHSHSLVTAGVTCLFAYDLWRWGENMRSLIEDIELQHSEKTPLTKNTLVIGYLSEQFVQHVLPSLRNWLGKPPAQSLGMSGGEDTTNTV